MTTRRKVVLSVLIGLAAVVFGLWLGFGWLWDVTAGLLHPLRANFHLSGIVVDEDGNTLNDVRLTISKGHSYPPGVDPIPPDVERHDIDGYFEVKVRGYASAGLSFSRDGYYGEHLTFEPSRGPRGEARKSVVDRNVHVVMQKKGAPTKLRQELYREISIRSDGSRAVLTLEPDRSALGHPRLTLQELTSASEIEALTSPAIYLTVDEDEQIGGLEGPRVPLRFAVSMTDPGGGFIPIERRWTRPANREMWLAPEEGYQHRLVVNRHDLNLDYARRFQSELQGLASASTPPLRTYFYFRFGGLYGRGAIDDANPPRVVVENDGSWKVRVMLHLVFQPDGSRNLEDINSGP